MQKLKFIKTFAVGFVLATASCPQAWAVPPGAANYPTSGSCNSEGTCQWEFVGDVYPGYDTVWNGDVVISGTGNVENIDISFPGSTTIGSITFSPGLTSISYGAIDNIAGSGYSVDIPSTITKIGDSDLIHSNGDIKVVVPNGTTSISDYAFRGIGNITEVELPSSLTSIGDYAFDRVPVSIEIPSSVTSIGYEALSGAKYIDLSAASSNLTLANRPFGYFSGTDVKLVCSTEQLATICSKSSLDSYTFMGTLIEFDGTEYKIINKSNWEYTGDVYNSAANLKAGVTVAMLAESNNSVEETPKPKRLYYTPAEAAEHVNHSNNNKITFTFK